MPFLFHQNMRNFGGGVTALGRNAAYQGAFNAMTVAAGPLAGAGAIQVGGFTEITNNASASNQFSGAGGGVNLCGALGLTHVANVACGQTALARGPEYIALGVSNLANLVVVGRFFFRHYMGGLRLIHDVAPAGVPPAAWQNHISDQSSRDYRGLVYAVYDVPTGVGAGTNRIAVGFLHNLYTFEAQRILVMGQLPHMMARMGSTLGAGNLPVAKYIGGDFNVGVVSPRGSARIGFCHAYASGMAPPPPVAVPPLYPAFNPGGTLWSGNLYDYWFTDFPPAGPGAPPAPILQVPVSGTIKTTLNAPSRLAGSMSDHCASTLRFQ